MGEYFLDEGLESPGGQSLVIFSSLLEIKSKNLDQLGWLYKDSHHLHVLFTFCPPLTCQLSIIKVPADLAQDAICQAKEKLEFRLFLSSYCLYDMG